MPNYKRNKDGSKVGRKGGAGSVKKCTPAWWVQMTPDEGKGKARKELGVATPKGKRARRGF